MKLLFFLKRSVCRFSSPSSFFGLAYVPLRHGAYLSLREIIFLQASPENFDSKSLTLLEKREHLKGKNS